MEKFKIIHEEKYCDINSYLYALSVECNFLYPLALYTDEEDKYMIIRIDSNDFDDGVGYAIAYYEDGNLKTSLSGNVEKQPILTSDGFTYFFFDSLVQRVRTEDGYYESIQCIDTPYPDVKDAYDYKQMIGNNCLDLLYPVRDNITESVTYYLPCRIPEEINFSKNSLFSFSKCYILHESDYYRFKMIGNKPSYTRPISQTNMYEVIESKGFKSSAPDDLVKAYTKKRKAFNDIFKAIETYKKETSY